MYYFAEKVFQKEYNENDNKWELTPCETLNEVKLKIKYGIPRINFKILKELNYEIEIDDTEMNK
jgi:hypothetical protein